MIDPTYTKSGAPRLRFFSMATGGKNSANDSKMTLIGEKVSADG